MLHSVRPNAFGEVCQSAPRLSLTSEPSLGRSCLQRPVLTRLERKNLVKQLLYFRVVTLIGVSNRTIKSYIETATADGTLDANAHSFTIVAYDFADDTATGPVTRGVAWLRGTCDSGSLIWRRTNVNEYTGSALSMGYILGHEIGHNLGLSHDFLGSDPSAGLGRICPQV